jgi:hypothetical protein
MTYPEDLARWRQQRRQAEAQSRLDELRQEHAQAARERDTAIANNDLELAGSADDQCQYLENEYVQLVGPPRPQWDPRTLEFLQKNRAFRERHGAAADQALLLAHQYAVRPRNPNASNPAQAGMGLTPNTLAYFQAVRDLLQMYARDYGLNYDPSEEASDWKQAAKASGVSEKTYADAYRALKTQGRVS